MCPVSYILQFVFAFNELNDDGDGDDDDDDEMGVT